MQTRISKLGLYFILAALGVGVLNGVSTSAYRGIDSFVCRQLAGSFAKSPALLRYQDLDRLGDCVSFYKRIYSVMRRGEAGETERPKAHLR